ncbi:phosphopantetheine-binding protein [Streptomyces sp. ME19-01-6]|uniref:phosphopantetheine-binding protein n=1 Tax=Streptomyces sp. ME19-01-6 TaxID=3028686 RepID=UPI0029B85258|nr:phosphopantetheine-binding protein [Streptomyces sp. ME19-01-6]MDX3225229.1 phosphopantetheine-binding protein [Streptomyces sp. ME19-01-6]
MTAPWNESFEAILRSLLRGLSDDAPLQPEQNLAAVGLDSMASVELLLELEKTFAIEVPDELLQPATFATAGALWQAVSGLRAAEPQA